MPKAYIQLGASGSSPSICPARATGCDGHHHGGRHQPHVPTPCSTNGKTSRDKEENSGPYSYALVFNL